MQNMTCLLLFLILTISQCTLVEYNGKNLPILGAAASNGYLVVKNSNYQALYFGSGLAFPKNTWHMVPTAHAVIHMAATGDMLALITSAKQAQICSNECLLLDGFVDAFVAEEINSYYTPMILLAANGTLYISNSNSIHYFIKAPQNTTRIVHYTASPSYAAWFELVELIVLVGNDTLLDVVSNRTFQLIGDFVSSAYGNNMLHVLDSYGFVYFFALKLVHLYNIQHEEHPTHITFCYKELFVRFNDSYIPINTPFERYSIPAKFMKCSKWLNKEEVCNISSSTEKLFAQNCFTMIQIEEATFITWFVFQGLITAVVVVSIVISFRCMVLPKYSI